MKKISLWASRHVWQARLLIAVLHVVLITLALTMGILLYMEDFHVTRRLMVLTQAVVVMAFLLYPVRIGVGYLIRHSYRMQKRFDVVMLLCGVVLFAGWSNRLAFEPLSQYQLTPHAHTAVHRADMPAISKDKRQERKEIRVQLRVWKEDIKQELKAFKYHRRSTQVAEASGSVYKALAVLGVFLVGIIALRGIAALSCSLSCSGYGAAAAIVLIGGVTAVVLLSIMAIRMIGGRKRKPMPDPVPDDVPTPPSVPTQ